MLIVCDEVNARRRRKEGARVVVWLATIDKKDELRA